MTAREFFGRFLHDRLLQAGFQRERGLDYARRAGDCVHSIRFHSARNRLGATYITGGVGITFDGINELFDSDAEHHAGWPSVGTNIGYVPDPSGKFGQWYIDDDATCEAAAGEIARLIDEAEVFFAEYSDRSRLRDRLLSEAPRDWFSFDRDGRDRMIACLDESLGERDAAMARLDEAIRAAKAGPRPRTEDLEYTYARIKARGTTGAA